MACNFASKWGTKPGNLLYHIVQGERESVQAVRESHDLTGACKSQSTGNGDMAMQNKSA